MSAGFIVADSRYALLGTPTVVVPNETLNSFAATDFPLIIATEAIPAPINSYTISIAEFSSS